MTKLDPIPARLAALKTTPTLELKNKWRELFETEPPAFNRRYLESRLAYRIQELAYGGLKPETIKRLEALGEQLKLNTKSARSSGPENIDPQRPHSGLIAQVQVLSLSRIALENNGKIRRQPNRENALAGASGGDEGSHFRFHAFHGSPCKSWISHEMTMG